MTEPTLVLTRCVKCGHIQSRIFSQHTADQVLRCEKCNTLEFPTIRRSDG